MAHYEDTPTTPGTTTAPAAERVGKEQEKRDFLSPLSLVISLGALLLALGDIAAILLIRLGYLPVFSWQPEAQRIVAAVAVILGAVGIGLNLLDAYHLLARHKAFDPRETERGMAIDDLTTLLSRLRQGCAVRVMLPLGLIGALVTFLLSMWVSPFNDGFQITGGNVPEYCSTSGTLSPFTLQLDNSASTVGVSWSAQPVETVPSGDGWAEIDPSQGQVAPLAQQQITVIPNALTCNYATATRLHGGGLVQSLLGPRITTYHLSFHIAGLTTRDDVIAVPVGGEAPTPPGNNSPTVGPTVLPSPSPTIEPTFGASPTPTSQPTATPTPPPPCSVQQTLITNPANGSTYTQGDQTSITFVGTFTGTCTTMPPSDTAWYAYNYSTKTFTYMGQGAFLSYQPGSLAPATYAIYYEVYDPSTTNWVYSYIQITVVPNLG